MATAAHPSVGVYELDAVHSTVQFAVRHVLVSTFRGSFSDVTAQLTVDDDGVGLVGRVPVESISIVEPVEFRDHVVRGADFFDAASFPAVVFRSTGVELDGHGDATVAGTLTIRGVSRPVTARGTYSPPRADPFGNVRAGLELRAVIDRRSWGMTWQMALPDGGDALGWDVEITAQLEFVRAD
jgi:polyisoprenoid-binding protein YceI